MKNLFEPAAANEIRERLARLTPQSQRAWGKMSAAQMLAHCANSLDAAVGDVRPPRLLAGWLLGWAAKRGLKSDQPPPRNSPTTPDLRVRDEREFERERQRLAALIDRFVAGGPAACTTHPHSFFGALAPEEWATLLYKHLDHHFRQFQV